MFAYRVQNENDKHYRHRKLPMIDRGKGKK